jgi:hypothetical protein
MKDIKTPRKLTRAQIAEGLDTVPVSSILGRGASRELTAKQKRFALEVAKGATKADAYRRAYDVTSKHTMKSKPYELTRDARIQAEVDAYKLAIETAEHRTPAALRELVIQTLAQVLVDPEAKQAVKVQAAKVLGTVTEVAAFTERKEVRTITSSEDARAQLMAQIRQLTNAQAVDAEIVERDAASLMAELENSGADEPHPGPTPHDTDEESHSSVHIDPHEQPPLDWIQPDGDPTPSPQEDPPVGQ